MFVVITLPDSPIALQKEKFTMSATTTIVSEFCGLAEAQSFCTCVGKKRSRLLVRGIPKKKKLKAKVPVDKLFIM